MNPAESLQALQKAEVESVFALSQALLRGFEQLSKLQLQMMRDALQHSAQTLDASASLRGTEAAPAGALPAAGEKRIGDRPNDLPNDWQNDWQNFVRIVADTQAEMSEILTANLRRVQTQVQDSAKQGVSALPAGTEPLQALFQTAVEATTQAIEAMQNAQQRATRLMSEQAQHHAAGGKKPSAPARKRSS